MAKKKRFKWTDTINPSANNLRVRLVSNFLEQGGGTLDEMCEYVNMELVAQNHKAIGRRLVQNALQTLRSGDFEHAQLPNFDAKDLPSLFKVDCVNGNYRYAKGSPRPVFDDFDQEEIATSHFLFGILDQYRYLPAVNRFLNDLKHRYKASMDDHGLSEFRYLRGPVLSELVQYPSGNKKNTYLKLLFELHDFIRKRQKVEFHYGLVGNMEAEMKNYTNVQVEPLQVVLHDYFYYLLAAKQIGNKRVLRTYRIDQIKRYMVNAYTDPDTDEEVLFDYDAVADECNLASCFDFVVGMEIPGEKHKLHKVTICFKGWAASYVNKLTIHPSQKIVSVDLAQQSLVMELKLMLAPEKEKGQKILDRSISLAFFLSRFREFAEILEAKPLK
jgi:hypothetical protein